MSLLVTGAIKRRSKNMSLLKITFKIISSLQTLLLFLHI